MNYISSSNSKYLYSVQNQKSPEFFLGHDVKVYYFSGLEMKWYIKLSRADFY